MANLFIDQEELDYWNSLDEESQDSYLETAKEEAKEENKELRKLGYRKDDDEWYTKKDIAILAKNLAWQDSNEYKAMIRKNREEKKAKEEAARLAELKIMKDAYDRGMVAYQNSEGEWEEEPISLYEGRKYLDVIKSRVAKAIELGL